MKRVPFGEVPIGRLFVNGGFEWAKIPWSIRQNRRSNVNAYRVDIRTIDAEFSDETVVWLLEPDEPRENVGDAILMTADSKKRGFVRVPEWLGIGDRTELLFRKMEAGIRWKTWQE